MFVLLLLTLAGAIAAGYAGRGRLKNLASVQLRVAPLLFAGLVAGLLPLFANLSRGADRALIIVSNALVAVFLAINVGRSVGAVRAGFLVIALGWVLNMAPILANEGMPLSLWAYGHSGQRGPVTEREGGFFKIVVADEHTKLRPLGDVIPIRPLGQVVSFGDLALVLGVGVVIAGGMRRRAAAPAEDLT